jgi:hypothetical protein
MGARPIGSSRKSCLESVIQHIHTEKYSLRQGVGGGLHSKFRGTGLGGEANEGEDAACWSSRLAQDVSTAGIFRHAV